MTVKRKPIKLFYDSEFTSLSMQGKLISMAFVSEDNRVFYAEFNDYPNDHLNPWIIEHVLSRLRYNDRHVHLERQDSEVHIKDNSEAITEEFRRWIQPFGPIEIYADCPSYDWVFFCDLFGSALDIPESIFYIPIDVATIFKCKNIDPDVSREDFVMEHMGKETIEDFMNTAIGKHNAIYDALITKAATAILISMT